MIAGPQVEKWEEIHTNWSSKIRCKHSGKTVVQAKEPPAADEAESLDPPSDLAGLRCYLRQLGSIDRWPLQTSPGRLHWGCQDSSCTFHLQALKEMVKWWWMWMMMQIAHSNNGKRMQTACINISWSLVITTPSTKPRTLATLDASDSPSKSASARCTCPESFDAGEPPPSDLDMATTPATARHGYRETTQPQGFCGCRIRRTVPLACLRHEQMMKKSQEINEVMDWHRKRNTVANTNCYPHFHRHCWQRLNPDSFRCPSLHHEL